jgi:hypothetical protein
MRNFVIVLFLSLSIPIFAKDALESKIQKDESKKGKTGYSKPEFSQEWAKKEETDLLTDKHSVRYTLTGTYLTAPNNASSTDLPALVVQCTPQPHNFGKIHTKGVFNKGYIVMPGGVVDTVEKGRIPVIFRLNDDKAQDALWNPSKDFSGMFFSGLGSGWEEFANLLYAHRAYHKDSTCPQVQKIIIRVPQFMGIDMVMQFILPDSREVADACGIISYKDKQK